ncbi:MAG: ATP-binding protein [Bradymonadaceae bacterium]|nr:ATP-binding protein [Lujinxingiaceae bacterium]
MTKRHAMHLREEKSLRKAIDVRREATLAGGVELGMDRLCVLYGLGEFERVILLMAAALAFSSHFEELYGQVGEVGHYAALTVQSVFDFFELSMAERITRREVFSRLSGPLVANDLIMLDHSGRLNAPEDLLMTAIHVSTRIFGLLVGNDKFLDDFMEFSSVEVARSRMEQVVLDSRDKQRVMSVVERHDEYLARRKQWGFDEVISYGRGVLMLFHGKPGTGKTMMAHAVADAMNKRVLNVDIPTFLSHRDAERFLPSLFREARIQNAVLFFDECELLFSDRRSGNALMTLLLTEIERFEGVAILATNMPKILDEALDRRILVKVCFPEPDREARRIIWQKHIPAQAPIADDVDIELLAERYELTGGYIKNVMLMAVAEAVHSGGATPLITMEILERAAREQMRRPGDEELSGLIYPRARLADVVLTPTLSEQIEELVDATRNRRHLLERWGIGQHFSHGLGVSALFYGPPGTGKTLCAEAVAGELNRALLTAQVPALQSKWVGELERNLTRLFADAQRAQAVLFLDEADSLLTERGAANASRHDDSGVNVLLTLIERFEGVVLLATNRPDALDPALRRRLGYTLEFAAPGADVRAAIWHKHLPSSVPCDGALDFEALARVALTGGQIKNAVVKAAFRAARRGELLSTNVLLAAAQDECPQTRSVGFQGAFGVQ